MYQAQLGEGDKRWGGHPAILDELKAEAKKIGLWNMFLPKNHFKEGAGFSNLEYGLMAEYLGKSSIASEVRHPRLHEPGLVLTCPPGSQLRRPRYREHGSVRQVWH